VSARWARGNVPMKKASILILALALATCSKSPGMLEEVLNSGELRVITLNSPTTVYQGGRGYEGPEYLLVKGFAEHLSTKYNRSIKVQMVTASHYSDLLPGVESHAFHFAAAGLAMTPERQQRVAFGPSYQEVRHQLVYRVQNRRPRSIADLQGKKLEIVAGSVHAAKLGQSRNEFPNLTWSENPTSAAADLLRAVADKRIDFTIVDSTSFDLHRDDLPSLGVAMDLGSGEKLAWAFSRRGTDKLRAEADEYFATIRESGRLEQIMDRYYAHRDDMTPQNRRNFTRRYETRLKNYRELFRQAGRNTQLDWRLLAAIAYQESHWDPDAVSPTGVKGLMMLTKATADVMKIADREDPAQSIAAGSRYLVRLQKRFKHVAEPDRTWLALAAYNIGYGHVLDAQQIVRIQGGNPRLWVDVKKALPLLTQSKWHSQVRHGYARGGAPVLYVEKVRRYYELLKSLTPNNDIIEEPFDDLLPFEPALRASTPRQDPPRI
jgi:membrane-bound lytic murein transglycosylase F